MREVPHKEYQDIVKNELDYDKLRKDLKEFLASQTKEDLEQWLEMDRKRMDEFYKTHSDEEQYD